MKRDREICRKYYYPSTAACKLRKFLSNVPFNEKESVKLLEARLAGQIIPEGTKENNNNAA